MPRYASSAASALLGAALAAVSFGAEGGFELSRVTWTEIGMVLAGATLVVAALFSARRGRLNGGLTLVAFAALAGLCGLSILWSIVPENSWLETNLTIAYLMTFAGAVALARVMPDGWNVLLRALLVAAVAICGYALATRVWPPLAKDEVFARLGQPYTYWNALGSTAALAVAPTLWLGSRRSGHPPANALAYPILTLSAITIFLSYSRGALVVAGIAAIAWLVLVPLRLRSIVLLGSALGAAAPVVVWALQKDAFTKNSVPVDVRESVATQFGLFVLSALLISLGIGLAVGFRTARRPPRVRARLRAGAIAAIVAVAAPAVMAVVLSHSDRGLGGTFKGAYESLTSSVAKPPPGGPARLLSTANSRGLYWSQARMVFAQERLKGTGAGTFGTARLRYRSKSDQSVSEHAHGYLWQTAADLGILGLVVSGLLAVVWLVAAGRATGFIRRRRHLVGWGPERVGLVALALAAITYGMHSAIDWIWFVPGPTVLALVAAGFVAGRGPLATYYVPEEVEEASPARASNGHALAPAAPGRPAAVPVGTGAGGTATAVHSTVATASNGSNGHGSSSSDAPTSELSPPPPPPPRFREEPAGPRRFGFGRVARAAMALAVVAIALVCAWTIWQPLRSDNESDHALDLAASGKFPAALAATKKAQEWDPLALRPLLVKSTVFDASSHPQAAKHALEQAVSRFPAQPQGWLQLAQYEVTPLNQPAMALKIIRAALFLDPQSRAAQSVFFQAQSALHPAPVPAPGAPAPGAQAAPAPAQPAQPPPAAGNGGTAPPSSK